MFESTSALPFYGTGYLPTWQVVLRIVPWITVAAALGVLDSRTKTSKNTRTLARRVGTAIVIEVIGVVLVWVTLAATAYYDVFVREYWDQIFGPDRQFATLKTLAIYECLGVVLAGYVVLGTCRGAFALSIPQISRVLVSLFAPLVHWELMDLQVARSGQLPFFLSLGLAIVSLWGAYFTSRLIAFLAVEFRRTRGCSGART